MSAATLLARLEAVRETAPGEWMARCPAHPDKHPSLSIKELPQGTILLNCFASCEAADILAVLGLPWAALYPERTDQPRRKQTGMAWTDVAAIVKRESVIAALAASDCADGKLSPADADRAALAAGRIRTALELAP